MMRKTMAALLAAAALAAPALAQDRDGAGGGPDTAPAVVEEGPAYRGESVQSAPAEARGAWRQERRETRQDAREGRAGERAEWRQQRRENRLERWRDRAELRQDRVEDRVEERAGDRGQGARRGDWRGWNDGRDWTDGRGRNDGRNWNDGRRRDDRRGWNDGRGWDGGRGWDDRRWGDGRGGWRPDWRRDRRYDWQDWRFRNREAFRLPPYRVPPGFGYRRFGPGALIPPPLFNRRYWLLDPWAYHLPPAWGQYRWIRYFDDVLLVDIRTGRVIDFVPRFFW